MAKRESDGKNSQRGQVLILVLIALALGSLLITPMLNYVYTGLIGDRISQEQLLEQYAADAALEYSLWQLKYNVDGLTDQLDPDNPSSNTSVTVNGIDVPITMGIIQSLLGETWPFPVPSTQSGIHLTTAVVISKPYISGDGQTAYFPHMVYMFNSGTAEVRMKAVFQQFDPRFTYVPGSYDGPNADITETYVDDHWELRFDFAEPFPSLSAQEATFITFTASTSEEVGGNTYTGSGWVTYAAFGTDGDEVFTGEYDPGTIAGYYEIIATAGSYTIRINVGITNEGEIVLLSYQIQ